MCFVQQLNTFPSTLQEKQGNNEYVRGLGAHSCYNLNLLLIKSQVTAGRLPLSADLLHALQPKSPVSSPSPPPHAVKDSISLKSRGRNFIYQISTSIKTDEDEWTCCTSNQRQGYEQDEQRQKLSSGKLIQLWPPEHVSAFVFF